MLRATMTRPGKIEFAEVPKPALGAHDVLLRIRRIGICGSDMHVYHGKHPYTSYPVVQGHEFCGEVAEVGRERARFEPGDLVTAPPQIVCGKCLPCREGRYHICENLKVIGFQAPGVAQEFFPFPESALLKLPAGFTPESGALVEPDGGGDPCRRPRRRCFRARTCWCWAQGRSGTWWRKWRAGAEPGRS